MPAGARRAVRLGRFGRRHTRPAPEVGRKRDRGGTRSSARVRRREDSAQPPSARPGDSRAGARRPSAVAANGVKFANADSATDCDPRRGDSYRARSRQRGAIRSNSEWCQHRARPCRRQRPGTPGVGSVRRPETDRRSPVRRLHRRHAGRPAGRALHPAFCVSFPVRISAPVPGAWRAFPERRRGPATRQRGKRPRAARSI